MVNKLAQTLALLTEQPMREQADRAGSLTGNPALSMLSDTERLTRAMVAGDERAFSQFYDLYSGRLFRLLLVLTSGQEDLVRDLHQVVMVKVARKLRGFSTDEKLWAWLAQVARHAFIDYVRKQNRQSEQPLSEFALASLANPDSQPEEPLMQLL